MNETKLKAFQPLEISDAAMDSGSTLNLMFNNAHDAEKFAKIFSGIQRVANIDLEEQNFTIGFIEKETKVSLKGNLYNAINLIDECDLISEASLKKHIHDTDLNIAVENSKEVVLQQKKVEREKYREKTPEQLVSSFSIAISPATQKKSASCFCFRRNKK